MEKRLLLPFLALALITAGCGAGVRAAPAHAPGATATATAAAEAARLRAGVERRDERIRELEAQLSLMQARVRELVEQVQRAQVREETAAHRTVHIGRHDGDEVLPPPPPPPREEPHDDGPRPVLTLIGTPTQPATPLVFPAAPPGVDPRLGMGGGGSGDYDARLRADVARIAALPVAALPPPGSALPPEVANDPVAAYRAALSLLERRRFDDAYAALSDFLGRWPSHPYADNAVYWRGEARYAQRQYVQALREFEDVVHRFPEGNKTPDALLEIARCHRRMGDQARAHLFFQRVARQYPESDAARTASREDAS